MEIKIASVEFPKGAPVHGIACDMSVTLERKPESASEKLIADNYMSSASFPGQAAVCERVSFKEDETTAQVNLRILFPSSGAVPCEVNLFKKRHWLYKLESTVTVG